MSTGQIILGIALFAVAAAILYAWGLKKSIDQVRDIGPLLKQYPFPAASALLHGKDLAWAAALLASGQRPFEALGEPYPVEEIADTV